MRAYDDASVEAGAPEEVDEEEPPHQGCGVPVGLGGRRDVVQDQLQHHGLQGGRT